MKTSIKHQDCRNFAPVDVAKGICHIKKATVLSDGEACDLFEKLPKCRHCELFILGEEEYIGTCGASPARPMVYPDLTSVTCEHFSWKKA